MALPNLFNSTIFGECEDSLPTLSVPGEPTPQLACILGNHELIVEVAGGTPPFDWIVTGGAQHIILDTTSISITIHPTPPQDPDLVQFLKANIRFFSALCPQVQVCDTDDLLDTVCDVRMGMYDCMKVHMNFIVNLFPNNLPPFHTSPPFAHPIGDNPADRTCVLTPAGSNVLGTSNLSDSQWSVECNECFPTGTFNSNCLLSASVVLAGKNGMHGTIHAAAPNWSFSNHAIVPTQTWPVGECGQPTENQHFIEDNWIDIRTQAQVDAPCCLAPGGTDIVVTLIDALDNVAILVIPVV